MAELKESQLFSANVGRWMRSCPKEAQLLSEHRCKDVEICKTHEDEINLSREVNGRLEYYHSPEGAMREAEDGFKALDLYKIETLFVYGVGLGYFYQAAKEWLAESGSRNLVFLEDDLDVIHRLFETERGQEMLFDEQVFIQYFEKTSDDEKSGIYALPLYYFLSNVRISALGYYARKFSDYLPLLVKQLEYMQYVKSFQMLEYMNFGQGFFQNFYRNMLELPYSYLADTLFGKFEGIPAIVCGAGPSLEANLPLLETLRERAIIISGGSAINTLGHHGFLPHFGVSIDPNVTQFGRLFMNQAYEVPFFYRNRIYPQALTLMHGDRLYVTRTGGHEIAKWCEERLAIKEGGDAIPEGNNVVNFSISIAKALGCNPIILVGVDLAYTDGKSYAPGIVPHPVLDAHKGIATRGEGEDVILKMDIQNKPVNTLWKWIVESMWVTQLAVTSPKLKVVNATEGGIGFDGVPNQALKEVAENLLEGQFDYSGFIHGEIQNSPLPETVTKDNILALIQELQESLSRCKDFCKSLRKEFNHVLNEIRSTKKVPQNLITDKALDLLKQLNREEAFSCVLKEFNDSFITFMGKASVKSIYDKEESDANHHDLNIHRTLINKKRYEFLTAVCRASLSYIKGAIGEDTLKKVIFDFFADAAQKSLGGEMQRLEGIIPEYAVDPALQGLAPCTVTSIGEYTACLKNEKPHGCYRLAYPSGKIKMEQYFKNSKLYGPASFYSEDGVLLARSHFLNGVRQGKMWTFYRSGKLHSLQTFKNGLWDGKQEFYFENGNVKSLLHYEKGVPNGAVVLYHPDGLKKRLIMFRKGKRNGEEIFWNLGGIKEFECEYVDDKPVGIARTWFASGNLSRIEEYDKESKVISSRAWNHDGTEIPTESVLEQDYFDAVKKQTKALTGSLETIFREVANLATQAKTIDLSDDMQVLHEEMENLKKISAAMQEKTEAVTPETAETLWKTPETKRLLGKQLQEATRKMTDDITALEEAIKITLELMLKKKPEK